MFDILRAAAECRCAVCVQFDREQGVFQRAIAEAQERRKAMEQKR